MLLKTGANVHLIDNGSDTSLSQDLYILTPEIIKMIIDAGADPEQVNKDGQPPLDINAHVLENSEEFNLTVEEIRIGKEVYEWLLDARK